MRSIIHTNYNSHNTFGSRLRAYRESKGIKVYDISRKLIENDKRRNNQIIDKSLLDSFRRTYAKWERDISFPDIIQVDILCNVLDCDFDFLMCKIDTPRKYVHDVKQIIGLSDESISILANAYEESKPTEFSHNIDVSKLSNLAKQMFKETDERRSSVYKEKLSVIDFIIKNGEDTRFLWHMYMYLFSDFTVENESDISLYNTLDLIDKNSGYTIHFDPSIAKEALLTKITYQLQKWKEEIEKSNH